MNSNINNQSKKIVRIMGLGQFEINIEDLRRINEIDNQIVKLLENRGNNESIEYEFKKQLELLDKMVREKGIAIDSKEILPSDVVLPNEDITLEEARMVFKGDGAIKDSF
ncbi:MAG TPA: hypothetical protein VN704_06905 [Verrucomicrobiae bacterium]|nr:hypothetical protein [Verrucomicrobiae bacterium]